MKSVAVLGNYLFRTKKTGIEVWAGEIVRRLLRFPDIGWHLLLDRRLESTAAAVEFPAERVFIGTGTAMAVLRDIRRAVRSNRFDAFFNPSQYTYFARTQRSYACGFDVAWRFYPDYFPASRRIVFEALTRYLCTHCARVFCISKSTRTDLVEHYGLDEDRAVLTYPGYDETLFTAVGQSGDEAALAKFGIRRPYLLHLGTLQRRKNIELLVEVFERLERPDLQLVLAGGRGWGSEDILRRVAESPRARDICVTGYVTDPEKAALYRGAAAFANLSLYEGFGIPIVEAMACGAPVVAARASAFPEIVERDDYLADLGSIGDIVGKTRHVLDADRERLSVFFRSRARAFRWDAAARTIHDCLLGEETG
jgi:glycosyltransferase involved in cell wall biosynthesis